MMPFAMRTARYSEYLFIAAALAAAVALAIGLVTSARLTAMHEADGMVGEVRASHHGCGKNQRE